ncbi:unnamed protein product [Diamesa hyperborea]
MNHKDVLYATPLRKSERHKNHHNRTTERSTHKSIPECDKLNNLNFKNNNSSEANGSADDAELKTLMDRTYLNSELGENRIKDFLKDTAHMHKKNEPPQGKEHISSSFSYLARKEHFVNLVNQNVLKDHSHDLTRSIENNEIVEDLNNTENLEDSSKELCGNLEETEKLINKLVDLQQKVSLAKTASPSISGRLLPTTVTVDLNREWVLKKIAMSLEQKTFKKLPPTLPETGEALVARTSGMTQQQLMQNSNLPLVGYLVLGSNGSGKTTICNDIINGVTGTKGMLNRRLMAFYFVNSQNPECHSLSIFIRNIVLQILSFSSLWSKQEFNEIEADNKIKINNEKETKTGDKESTAIVDKELEEMILSEIKLNERVAEFCLKKTKVIRQQSAPLEDEIEHEDAAKYTTHPPLQKQIEKIASKEESDDNKSEKSSPSKKISKIPVKIGQKAKGSPVGTTGESNDSIQTGGGEGIAEIIDEKLEEDIAKELNQEESPNVEEAAVGLTKPAEITTEVPKIFAPKVPEDDEPKSERPPPLPKLKDCRTVLADAYYEMLMSNPEIFESLVVDTIEKNPDDCFKKAILFPLLELNPPKNALLMLIDSIDENYLNDGTLISTLKGKSNAKSRNIAELLSNHIHLLPKWLFLVCTAKKQNKHITKLFSGFKKLTLDDLRKSHVVKDVQQYIINRLNVDFRGINLNKEIIDSLNQLYIKSNGCLLYLYKVLSGIKDNFFTFREIKLIPCTLYGLFLYLCQKSFNKKQYTKIRPILNVLLVCNDYVDKTFVFNCIRTHNYTIDWEEYQKRLDLMKNILNFDEEREMIRIFHNSFSEWLIDVKFSTKKFLCDLNEGHLMISMYYTLISDQLCPNKVREYVWHLIKAGEYLVSNNCSLDVLMILLESRTNLDSKVLKLLIETGINNLDSQLSCESSMLNSPLLSDKSQNMDSELAELLISNMEIHKGKAFIHILANDGNHVLLERALRACKNPVDLEIEDHNGQTALNIAARNGHLEIVKLLIDYNFPESDLASGGAGSGNLMDVNHADRDGWTPLRSASWGGHTEVVKLLISNDGCAIDRADKEGRTALRAAAWSGNEDIVKILIAAGANVNSIDKQGRTSLIAASYMGHYDIVEILLDNQADVNHTDLDGRNALCVAALCGSSGYSKVISTLLEHGANTDQTDNEGMSPLLVSSFEGNGEICELLLENGADPDLGDHLGRTPLWAACTSGHANVVKLLLFWGCGIDCMDSEGRTVLSVSAAQGNLETVRQLLDRGLDETHRDNAGWTPLHYSAFEGYADICIQLLESGAKIDECDNEGKAAIHLAAQEGHNTVIQALMDCHSACIDQRAHDGKTAFRLASLEGHFECVQTMLKYGCDVNLKDADSRTTLYILALENKLNVVKFLLDYSNVNVNIPDSEGRTALHVSAWQGHQEMVKLLITVGNADVNAIDLENRSPLHSCAWQGNHEVMQLLLYYGAVPDHACKQGATALGISAQEGHEECVSMLLSFGANPMKSDHCGRTPFKLAAKSNRNNVLKILENYTKNEHHPNLQLKSPDKPHEKSILQPSPNTPQNPNLLNISGHHHAGGLNATTSTQSSNFYENTMHSDTSSSAKKRKSVISSQSTGSSNEAPISFTQQLQKHSRHHNSKSSHVVQLSSSATGGGNHKKHSHILPNVDEYQNAGHNLRGINEADLFDCMSPLYATPPHSPSSDLSSPHDDNVSHLTSVNTDHFARDTHMRIILGNNIKEQKEKEAKSSKRSGIATNPAMRLIRNRIDSAANLIRRTNNYITSNSNSQGSSSIGVKSGTFQWRKESQM